MKLKQYCAICGVTLELIIEKDAPKEVLKKAEEELTYKAINHCIRINKVTGKKFFVKQDRDEKTTQRHKVQR